jgi:predicted nucleic acid-binding protein
MTRYLLDTNIVLRLSNPLDAQYELATDVVFALVAQGNECVVTPQVLIEFWVVATRPTSVNGFGWSLDQATASIDRLLDRFPLLEDRLEIFSIWLELITSNRIVGKRSHDIRLVAVMLAHGVDFGVASNIQVIHPQTVT